jgi:hypothetical protein
MSTESLVSGSSARMCRALVNHSRKVALSAVIFSSSVLKLESAESSKSGAMYLTVPFKVPGLRTLFSCEFCSSCVNRSINSRRSCGVSALTSLIILLSASVDIAVSTLPTIYHTDHERREGQHVKYQGSGPKSQKRGAATEGRPQPCPSVALNDIRQQFVLNRCHLRLDHAEKVQLTAAREGQVFKCVRECFRTRGVFNRRHQEEKRCLGS